MSDDVVFRELKNGDKARVQIMRGFTPEEAERIRRFLGHKGAPYIDHVDDFLANGVDGVHDGLEWRFFVSSVGDVYQSNICVWEYRGVGILGHVYTAPEARGLGHAGVLMRRVVEDFKRRGGRRLYLNTDPGSFQEAFYGRYGFRKSPAAPGSMALGGIPEAATSEDLRLARFAWRHWPSLNELFLGRGAHPSPDKAPRMAGMKIDRHCSVETAILLAVYRDCADDAASRLWVLEDARGEAHGLATILPIPPARKSPKTAPEPPRVEAVQRYFDVVVSPKLPANETERLTRAVLDDYALAWARLDPGERCGSEDWRATLKASGDSSPALL